MTIRVIVGNPADIIKEIEATVTEETEKMMTDLDAGLVRATPVDTGHARNGWVLTLGPNPAIENMVPYIGVLNDGHSKQAPALFIEAEIDRATRR